MTNSILLNCSTSCSILLFAADCVFFAKYLFCSLLIHWLFFPTVLTLILKPLGLIREDQSYIRCGVFPVVLFFLCFVFSRVYPAKKIGKKAQKPWTCLAEEKNIGWWRRRYGAINSYTREGGLPFSLFLRLIFVLCVRLCEACDAACLCWFPCSAGPDWYHL